MDGILRDLHGCSGTIPELDGCAYTQTIASVETKAMEMAVDDTKTLGQAGSQETERWEAAVQWPQGLLAVESYHRGEPNLEQCLLA